jgi:hypothetical protein
MKQELIIKTGEQDGSKRCCKKIEFIYINIFICIFHYNKITLLISVFFMYLFHITTLDKYTIK